MLQSLLGGLLLRFLFRISFGAGHELRLALSLRINPGFNREHLTMVRAFFLDSNVNGLESASGLEQFLQSGFVVSKTEIGLALGGNAVQFGLKNLIDDEFPGLFQA